jgi:glycosyltransferase involved in cell wall biosynthesis
VSGLRVLIVSGIWPPDIGGPAAHGPDLANFLIRRGHAVRAVTSCERGGPEPSDFPLLAVRRDRPRPVRLPAAALAIARAARGADVIYAAGMYTRSGLASRIHRLPLVLKLASDPAYERARNLRLFSGGLEEFQRVKGSPALRGLKLHRRLALGSATRLIIPSHYLADIARGWGLDEERINVIPNPAPEVDCTIDREELRRRLGLEGPTFIFAGRLVPAKNLALAISALRLVPAASLVIVGDGPARRGLLEAIASSGVEDRVVLKGALPRSAALEWLRSGDAALLSSSWENHPHAAVEAIAAGTPVIATAVGGVPEIVRDGVNGLLVEPGDVQALARAMRSLVSDPDLLARLRHGAAVEAGRFSADRAFGDIERELELAAGAQAAAD